MSIQKHDLREFTGQNLTAIDIPLGAVGGSVIRMNGKAQRQWWHIFNNYEERLNTGRVPNSFFAIRTSDSNIPMVKVLQTESEGPFEAFKSLRLRSQYPFAYYDFQDSDLPVSVSMEVSSFLIPMDLKNSAIPCAIFKFMVNNNSQSKQSVSLLATQQNAVGFDGYEVHSGFENRNCSGYGSNKNIIVNNKKHTSLQMSGNAGSMQLSAYTDNVKGTSSFGNLLDLHDEFIKSGKLSGPQASQSPSEEETLVGALCKEIELKPGEEKSITFVLSWHIPKGSFGKTGSLAWDFSQAGCQYENFWSDANTVDDYVFNNFKDLYGKTRLYTDTLYESNIPGYVIDRISSNISVLKSPTSFWTKDGYYGLWESTSNNEEWLGNCKHVYHYAQAHARLFPELGRILRKQDIKSMTKEGLLPARDGDSVNALDGHCGTILSIYREHLLSENKTFLESIWGKTKEAMFYMITIHDPEETGMVSGSYHNTLDCNVSGTSPWIGSLYLAALKACSIMASLVKDTKNKDKYESIFEKGKLVQNTELWNEELGVYIEKSQALPNTLNMNKGISIDMFLGQWWSNQLGLGELYPTERICRGLLSIYKNNKFTDTDGHYEAHFRDFLGKGDTGWMMCTYPKGMPKKPVLYYDEIMSGFEYSFATTMIQYGLQKEGLHIIQEIFKRYDGRLRAENEVHMANNSTVYGTGSPVGEDECGDFYGRAMSSWSSLLALQGFQYDGPDHLISFKPTWQPNNHHSFFSTSLAWGLFTQKQEKKSQTIKLQIRYGKLSLSRLNFEVPQNCKIDSVLISKNDILEINNLFNQEGHLLSIELEKIICLSSESLSNNYDEITIDIEYDI